MKVEKAEVIQAFNWLKRDNYYDTINLFLRKKIADFDSLDKDSENLIKDTLEGLKGINSVEDSRFLELLNEIDFHIIPKKFKKIYDEEDKEIKKEEPEIKYTFLSNLREQKSYPLESLNYFIDAPVELLIISVLWSQRVGYIFNDQLYDNCLGNRLSITEENKEPFTLFKYYLPMYNKWRDKAIEIGLSNLEKGNDILLIALDIKECYYNLQINWASIYEEIEKANLPEDSKLLTKCIQAIHEKYQTKISKFLKETHYNDENKYKDGPPKSIIPIGLPSSGILANWELRRLDENITKTLRPLYYGRYVDDFLLVLNYPDSTNIKKSTPFNLIKELFTETDILNGPLLGASQGEKKGEDYYEFVGYDYLTLQSEKLIFHYYNHNSNWAGLTKFNDELRKQASEFRFLPEDFSSRELSDEAYDIEYKDSINKLRSVIGVNENHYKLVNYLYALQLKKWLSQNEIDAKALSQLEKYFQGINILQHYKIWERLFSLLTSERKWDLINNNYRKVNKCIEAIDNSDEEIKTKAISDLQKYLDISVSLSLSLLSEEQRKEYLNKAQTKSIIQESEAILEQSNAFRESHMIRHQFSSWPLLEYIDSKIDLSALPDFSLGPDIEEINFKRTPRYIHFDDFQLLNIYNKGLDVTLQNPADQNPAELWKEYNESFLTSNNPTQVQYFTYTSSSGTSSSNNNSPDSRAPDTFGFRDKENKDDFIIGMVNLKVPGENLESTLSNPNNKNNHEELQKALYTIINEADKYPKCDLIVLPEMSVPIHFLPFIVNQSRKRQIGFVLGCEHVVHGKECLNLVFVVLPDKNYHNYKNCAIFFRNKHHFAPKEGEIIRSYEKNTSVSKPNYFRHYWRNCYFSVFNCFELTDIKDRAPFRAYLDLLIGISWNKDINRFSNIIESTVGDLHCYMAYVNTSQYGHSRIVAPKKTEEMNIAEISGGENTVLLKGKIDIKSLRDFQKHAYRSDDKRFKPTPAGFEHEIVRNNRQNTDTQNG